MVFQLSRCRTGVATHLIFVETLRKCTHFTCRGLTVASIAESSQSIIPHSEEQGLRSTEVNPKKGDEVEVHMLIKGNGRLHTSVGRVRHVDLDPPKWWVRLYGHKYYHEVLRNITRHSTSMISNDTQSSSEYSISQSY